jgi:DNA invertase Pin-like site-specific DNA recombinase
MTKAEHRAWWAERTDVAYGLCWCGCGKATSISTRTDRANGYACGRPFAYVRGHATALKRGIETEDLPEPNPSGLCMCGCGQKTSLAKQTNTQAGWVRGKPLQFLPNHFPRKLTKEQEAEACRRYADGETCNEIGASFGVSRKTVARVLECHGVSIRPKSTPRPGLRLLSLDQESEICQRYEAGESSDALGKAFGVSGITVRKALERNGVQRRPGVAGPPLTPQQRAEICRRYVEGEHHKAIAEAFDVEPGTIYRVLKREGVSPRIVPYTEQQRSEVCRRYLAGDEIQTICEAANMNVSNLYTVLRDNGIERARMIWATEAEEVEICRRYVEGESGPVLARDFGVTDGAILGVLQRHGVPRRSSSEALRRYSCDHSFFDEIDTEAKAYWLGFIAADGCVTDKNVLSISLSSRDHDHLLRFKADIQASHPVAS